MKKAKISFRAIGGSGPLTISWFDGPKGDAMEANNALGVGFFASDGTLLCVEFDDVEEKSDHKVLEFDHYRVEVAVKGGKVSYSMTAPKKRAGRSKSAKDKDAA